MSDRWVRLERMLEASPARIYRSWTSPDDMTTWFAPEISGALAPGTRSVLKWPEQSLWLDMLEAEPDERIRFRWPWLAHDAHVTEVTVELHARGYGSRLELKDGPFDITKADQLDAFVKAVEGWTDALANLRATLDFSVDLRRLRGGVMPGPR